MNKGPRNGIFGFSVLLGFLCIISFRVGRYEMNTGDIFRVLTRTASPMKMNVFFNLRLPRTILVMLAGFTLAYVGSILQTIFKNPLAAPEIIGVSSGASAGAAFSIVALGGGFYVTMASAFIGAILALGMSLLIASKSNQKSLASFVLSGIAVNALAQSAIMFLKMAADPERQLASIEFWMMGGFNTITASKVRLVIPITLIALFFLILYRRQIEILSLKDDEARALGVNIKRIRPIILMLCSIAVASIVSVSGLVSFIGLIGPHLSRLIVKRNSSRVWMISGLIGSSLLLISDIIARSISASEIPISICTSFIGAPVLIYLMMRKEHLV
ncbi:MAG: iron ABC transporter permease [Epulopiscium sp.]|nr:iron ABC transporter permease [Candidatus Epulonipiscium sp.]